MNVSIVIAREEHYKFAQLICDTIEASAIVRGTGIAKRNPEYIVRKMKDHDAIIATIDGDFAGFCYIESWQHGKYVANSGLIVHPDFRNMGLAKSIKKRVFEYSKTKYPGAKIFGITTGLAVMKMNSELGYKPVPFSELTDDPMFWNGCRGCTNYSILESKKNKLCLCTGMLYDPNSTKTEQTYTFNQKVLARLKSIKLALFLPKEKK